MQLTDIIKPDCVKVPLIADEKFQAIAELIDVLDGAGLLSDRDIALKTVCKRESIRSTGIGLGFAIPHGKCSAVDRLVMVVGKTARPIDFDSIDKKPVETIFLLISPLDRTGPHIQALALISRLMTDTQSRGLIEESTTAQQLYTHIVEYKGI